ncbi:DNA-methyltransferase [Streptomyces sp. NPDC002643]
MTSFYQDDTVTLLLGDALDALREMPDRSVDCIVTSPPYYGLRDYGMPGQYGLERTPVAYAESLRQVFAEARRVLTDDGTFWLNLGDSYASPRSLAGQHGHGQGKGRTFDAEGRPGPRTVPPKNLFGIPWRVAFALQDDGWILRNAIIWSKSNAMPESVTDRLSTRHEYLFLFVKQPRYWFDLDAIRQPHAPSTLRSYTTRSGYKAPGQTLNVKSRPSGEKGKNPGDVWSIATKPYPKAHFAVFPVDLPLRCITAGCKPNGTVLDPFSGAGTTGLAARQLGRRYVGIDLNPEYHQLTIDRLALKSSLADDGAAR